ncbi:MAG: hypothetical protein MK066_03635 [Crocinitomicaceae bacterium]|nr:hypothetical protein [Crocinitomicaceae bacterium]
MKKILFLTLFIVLCGVSYSQPYKTIKTYKPYKWMLGINWSAIDDNGDKFGQLFDTKKSWNALAFPSTISLDRYFTYGWSMEGIATYSKYKEGNLINDSTHFSGTFFGFDVNGKYSFYQLYAPALRWIDPFLSFGVGYTYRPNAGTDVHSPMVNLGGGVNFWVHKNFGFQVRSQAKFGVFPVIWDTKSNYLHHSAGIVIRYGANGKHQNGEFDRKKNKWVHGRNNFKKRGGR